MRILCLLLVIATAGLLCSQVLGDDRPVLTIAKASIPYVFTSTDKLIPKNFPSGFCTGTIENSNCYVTMVQCDDKKKPATTKRGKFFQSSCMAITCQTAVATDVSFTCATEDFSVRQTFNFMLIVQDSAPTCQNLTYPVANGPVIFQLRAGDADDVSLLYHIRQASSDALVGTLEYCQDCSDSDSNYVLYSKLQNQSLLTRWARRFRYTPPANISSDFKATLQFSATDISNNDCPRDGFVTFTNTPLDPPSGKPATYTDISVAVQQTIKISATPTHSQRISFTLKTLPSADCAILCTIPETARQALKVAPGQVLSGDVLGNACTAETALKAGNDITMTGKSDTFAFRTFLIIKALKVCQQNFEVAISEKGVAGSPSTVSFTSIVAAVHSCMGLPLTTEQGSFKLGDAFNAPAGTNVVVSVLSGMATVNGATLAGKTMALSDLITLPSMSQTLRLEIASVPDAPVAFDEFCSIAVSLPPNTPQPPPPPPVSNPPANTPAPQQSESTPVPTPARAPTPIDIAQPQSENSTKARVLWFFVLVAIVGVSFLYRKVIIAVAHQLCGGGKYRPLGQETEMGRR